jgi:hypothetical protein
MPGELPLDAFSFFSGQVPAFSPARAWLTLLPEEVAEEAA